MHPSTAQASVIVDELVRCGVRHVVACPGSRNAPLSMALFGAAAVGRITLHVRIDERSAAFLALGIGAAGAGPAAVCCTSGTAAANFHPAVLEAHHARVPLLVITADRPAELLGTGANQTIEQRGLYGVAAPCVDMPLAERRAGGNAVWRSTVCQAVARAVAGPVQVNVPFREPLVPDDDPDWPEPLTGRAGDAPWTRWGATVSVGAGATGLGPRTVVLAGDPLGRPERITAAARVAAQAGWPVIAEPTAVGPALAGGNVLAHGSLLLNAGVPPRPDDVVVVGRPTLSRGVAALARSARRVVVLGWTDPQRLVAEVADHVDPRALPEPDPRWLARWRSADRATGAALAEHLRIEPWPTGLHVAAALMAALPADAVLFLGSSNPVRYTDLGGRPGRGQTVLANRGVAGIDGSVATASGIALATPDRPCYALLGDLTFLHDVNGLLIGPDEARPNLTIVVLNDDGGSIFATLEQGAPEYAASFERVFGTPHHTDLAALCGAYHVPHMTVSDVDELKAALAPSTGLRVVEIHLDRKGLRDEHQRLFAAVRSAGER